MSYASFANQVYHISHFFFAVWLLFIFLPTLFFGIKEGTAGERYYRQLIGAVFLYILIGYILVLVKLYEVLALLGIFAVLILRRYLFKKPKAERERALSSFAVSFYNGLDTGFRLKLFLKRLFSREGDWMRWSLERSRNVAQGFASKMLLIGVLGGSAYLRFYDALHDAAPPLSDSYVTLAWMKYISERIMFHDGIYPQGFHIILATIHKFSGIDQVYVLKYMGPLVGMLITYSLYFVVSRWTKNASAGVVAAALYGLFGYLLLGTDWERQAATNSQEFAMLFLLPSLYFYLQYLREGKKESLWVAWAAATITGLVHTFVFMFVGLGLGAVLLPSLLFHFRAHGKQVLLSAISGILAVALSFLPFGLGQVLGRGINQGAEEFLQSFATVPLPDLDVWDEVGVTGILLTLLSGILIRLLRRKENAEIYVGMIGLFFFLIYEFGGTFTGSVVLASRSSNVWALILPIFFGFSWAYLWRGVSLATGFLLRRRQSSRKWDSPLLSIEAFSLFLLLVLSLIRGDVKPIAPYKMEWSAGVDQYLRIASMNRPLTWMIVSQNEGYDLALGNGYHMYLGDFLKRYDPAAAPLTRMDTHTIDRNIPYEIYIYHEKKVFRVREDLGIYSMLEPTAEKRERENAELKKWINTYQMANGSARVYYEDDHLVIYHLTIPTPENEKRSRYWLGFNLEKSQL